MSEQTHGQNQDPQFSQSFIETIESVTAYNDRHTGIGSAMLGMFDMVMSQVEGYEKPKVSRQEEADMEKELTQLIHTDELTTMGVSLFDSSAPGVRQISEEEIKDKQKRPATLFMLITDGQKFGDTVRHLKPAPEQENQVSNGVNLYS